MVMNRGMIGNEEREIRECKAMDVFESQDKLLLLQTGVQWRARKRERYDIAC